MVAPAIPTQAGRPANAFAEPLRRVPRPARLAFLVGFRAVSGFIRHDGLSWSAAMAFWAVLSLPPLLVALSALAVTVVGRETAQAMLTDQIAAQLPAQGDLLANLIDRDTSMMTPFGLGSLLFLLFSGSRVFAALVTAINVMWRHVEEDGFLRRQLMRLVLVVAVGGLMLISAILQLGVLGAEDEFGAVAGFVARTGVPFLLVVAGLFVTYLLIPRGRATWRTALVAALITAALLRLAQLVFWFLLTAGVDFSTGYGPLAGVAILMTWAVVASGVVLLGAEFVATLDRHRLDHVPLPSSAEGDPHEQNA
ncbi:MAG: YihY/virulence factor BrkB family protein [Chloroflexota bacterium]|nr:YihY/virulence factor BrkB family protein [Chloroflexota bacterium]